jgi:hypothetical protein
MERTPLDVLEDRVRRARDGAEEIASLRDDRLAGDERTVEVGDGCRAGRVVTLAAVEDGHEASGVEQNGLHERPKPRR